MGNYHSHPEPPPGAHVEVVENSGGCDGQTCSANGRVFDGNMPKPPAAAALDDESWRQFTVQMSGLVSEYRRDGRALLVFLLFPVIWTMTILGPSGLAPILNMYYLLVLVAWGIGGLHVMKQANEKLDERICACCARFSNGAVELKWQTRHTGTCKPKGVRVYRALWVCRTGGEYGSQGAPMVASGVPVSNDVPVAVATPAAPASQMMQITCPAGSRAGDALTVATPAGQHMQVVVPQGVSAGQAFSVVLPAMPVVTANAVPVASAMPV
jgi:hypothetical protein